MSRNYGWLANFSWLFFYLVVDCNSLKHQHQKTDKFIIFES